LRGQKYTRSGKRGVGGKGEGGLHETSQEENRRSDLLANLEPEIPDHGKRYCEHDYTVYQVRDSDPTMIFELVDAVAPVVAVHYCTLPLVRRWLTLENRDEDRADAPEPYVQYEKIGRPTKPAIAGEESEIKQ
jgi:hypothetical protein